MLYLKITPLISAMGVYVFGVQLVLFADCSGFECFEGLSSLLFSYDFDPLDLCHGSLVFVVLLVCARG